MPHVLKRLPTTLKLRDALATVSPAGHPIGLASRPKKESPPASGTWVDLAAPYGILYPLWETPAEAPPFGADRDADVWWNYQVSLYALRGDQLEVMRDKATDLVLGKSEDGETWLTDLDVTGVKIIERERSDDTGAEEPVGDLYPSSIRFRLRATPA